VALDHVWRRLFFLIAAYRWSFIGQQQVDDEHSERVQDRKHQSKWCNDSASRRESMPDEIIGKDRLGTVL
jgi:hypothetical protein